MTLFVAVVSSFDWENHSFWAVTHVLLDPRLLVAATKLFKAAITNSNLQWNGEYTLTQDLSHWLEQEAKPAVEDLKNTLLVRHLYIPLYFVFFFFLFNMFILDFLDGFHCTQSHPRTKIPEGTEDEAPLSNVSISQSPTILGGSSPKRCCRWRKLSPPSLCWTATSAHRGHQDCIKLEHWILQSHPWSSYLPSSVLCSPEYVLYGSHVEWTRNTKVFLLTAPFLSCVLLVLLRVTCFKQIDSYL